MNDLPPSVISNIENQEVLAPVVVSSDNYGNYSVVSGSTQTIQDIQKKQAIVSAKQKSDKELVDVIKERYNKQQEARKELKKQQDIKAQEIKETTEQKALILATAQQEVEASSKFESLRSRKLAELKTNIKEERETTVDLAGGRLQLVGTVKPFVKKRFITTNDGINLEESIPKNLPVKEIENRLNQVTPSLSEQIKESLIDKEIQQTKSIKPELPSFNNKEFLELEPSVKSGLKSFISGKQIQQTVSKDLYVDKKIIQPNLSNTFIGQIGEGVTTIGKSLISPFEASYEFGKTLREVRPYVLDVLYSKDIKEKQISSAVVKSEALQFLSKPKVQEGALVTALVLAPPVIDLLVAGVFIPQQTESFLQSPSIKKGTELAIIGGAVLAPLIIKSYKSAMFEEFIKIDKSKMGESFINTKYELTYAKGFKQKVRPKGFDIQRFLYEPAKERQLVLGEIIDPFSKRVTVDINLLPSVRKAKIKGIQKSLLDTPPKTFSEIRKFQKTGRLPIEKPLTEVETFLIKGRTFKPVETIQSKLIKTELIKVSSKTESGIEVLSGLKQIEYSTFGNLKSGKPIFENLKIESKEISSFSSPKSISRLFSSKKAQLSGLKSKFKEESLLKPIESSFIKENISPPFTEFAPKVLEGFNIKPIIYLGLKDRSDNKLKVKRFILNLPKDKDKINQPQTLITQNNDTIIKDNIVPKIKTSSINLIDTSIKTDNELISKSLIIPITDYGDYTKENIDDVIDSKKDIEEPIKPITSFKLMLNKEEEMKKKNIAYDTFVKTKGKFIKVNKKPLPENKSFNLGFDVVDNTPAATFKVKKSKFKTKDNDDYNKKGMFKLRQKDKNTYIEKNTYRIDSLGERRGITVKGYLARRKSIYSFF